MKPATPTDTVLRPFRAASIGGEIKDNVGKLTVVFYEDPTVLLEVELASNKSMGWNWLGRRGFGNYEWSVMSWRLSTS